MEDSPGSDGPQLREEEHCETIASCGLTYGSVPEETIAAIVTKALLDPQARDLAC